MADLRPKLDMNILHLFEQPVYEKGETCQETTRYKNIRILQVDKNLNSEGHLHNFLLPRV
jgi:hypothetical protein